MSGTCHHGLLTHGGADPATRDRHEVRCALGMDPAGGATIDHGPPERVLRTRLDGHGQLEKLRFTHPLVGKHIGEGRSTLRHRAGLVEHDGVHRTGLLQRFSIPDEDAVLGGLPYRDHDGDRCGQTQRARASDHEDGDRHNDRIAQRWSRTERVPGGEGNHGDDHDGGHEVARHHVHHPLDRRLGTLRITHHLDDARQNHLASDPLGHEVDHARGVDRAADDLVAWSLLDRNTLPGDHRLVHGAAALVNAPVNRNLFSGAHHHHIAHPDLGGRNLQLGTVADDPGNQRPKVHEAPNGLGGPALRAGLERLAEHDERDDDCRRLVKREGRPLGKEPGKGHGDGRIEPRRPRPESDQRVHVRIVTSESRPSPRKEATTDIHHDRDGQQTT